MKLRSAFLIATGLLLCGLPAAAQDGVPAELQLHQHGHGSQISDSKGMTLYTFERDDEPGKSTCVGACAQQWPPMLVAGEGKAGPDWSVITRPDNTKQWAFRGKPLYYYANDVAAGDVNGDGIGNQWHLGFQPIVMPPSIGQQRTLLGYVLADQKNLTLYTSEKDKPGVSNCDLKCSRTWIPVVAPNLAHPVADWTTVLRKDGTKQWAYKGKPVYRYAGDANVADTHGHNAEKGWTAAVLEPPPPNPSWITFHQSDAGELMADAKGRTIYRLDANRRGARGGALIDRPQDWNPVFAEADAKPVGSWSLIDGPEGKKQWAYKGLPLYTNNMDAVPGDINGVRSGDRRFQAIMRSGNPMQGTGV